MAEPKTKATPASVEAFVKAIDDPKRREDCVTLVALMKKVTKCEPKMWGSSIVGFGDHHYRYESGREGDTFILGFSPRKDAITVYLCAGIEPVLGDPRQARQAQDRQGLPLHPPAGRRGRIRPGDAPEEGRGEPGQLR